MWTVRTLPTHGCAWGIHHSARCGANVTILVTRIRQSVQSRLYRSQILGLAALAKNPIRPKMGLDWTCTMLLSWMLTVYLGINSRPSRFNQSRGVDKHAYQEVPFELHLRINLVGLEVTEPRMVPSNDWKSCLRPPPPGWVFHDGAAVKPLGC